MNLKQRWSPLHLLAGAAMVASLSCGDNTAAPGAKAAPAEPSRVISDGANRGNTDVFFLPPLVPNPRRAPGFGDPFQGGLPVGFRIRDITVSGSPIVKEFLPPSVCSDDGDDHNPWDLGRRGFWTRHGNDDDDPCEDVTDGFKSYRVNWNTKASSLEPAHTYRIEVVIGARLLAFADFDVVLNGRQFHNVNTNDFIPLKNGRTLPIRVRVEKGWACQNKQSCVAQVVPNTIPVGQKVVVISNDQLNAVAFEGTWNAGTAPVVVSIEDVSAQLGSTVAGCAQGLTKMLTTAHCIKITADPPITLTTAATVATCLANPGDPRQLLLKYGVGETPKFLANVVPPIVCPENTGAITPSSNRLVNRASGAMARVGRAVRWATGVKPAYALDLGVAGRLDIGDGFSYFSLALPWTFEAIAGQGQTALAGTTLPVNVTVRLDALHPHHGDPFFPEYVTNANVFCTIVGASGDLVIQVVHPGEPPFSQKVSVAQATNNGDGTYTCPPWITPPTAGTNTLHLYAATHDDMFFFLDDEGVNGTMDFTSTSVLPAGVINDVFPPAFILPQTLTIGGSAAGFSATIVNPGPSLTGVFLQGEIIQGATARAASSASDVSCGGAGIFAHDVPCVIPVTALASNTASGVGTLVPGPATFRLHLVYGLTSTDLSTVDTPITLAAAISLDPAGAALEVGQTVTLVPTVVLNAGAGSAVTWQTSSAFNATVNASGVVTAIAAGSANILAIAVADAGKTGTAPIAVFPVGGPVHISKLTITKTSLPLPSNPSGTWTATLVNTTEATATGLILQGTIIQGANEHDAHGVALSCAAGGCTVSFPYSTSVGGSIGPLVPGPATLKVELWQDTRVLDTKFIPVVLVVGPF